MKQRECVRFKSYDQSQPTFLPPSLDELIPSDHQVRFVNEVIDHMNLDRIYKTYKGGGTTSYHPRMLVKVLLYGYIQRIYSARKLAKATRENIQFMWLAGGQRPDFRTINEFRKSRLRTTLKELFAQLMQQLVALGLVDLNDYFLDGSKVEADARRHSVVWAKNVERHKASVEEQISELFQQIQQIADTEDVELGEADLAELGHDSDWDSGDVERAVVRINEALSETDDAPGQAPDNQHSDQDDSEQTEDEVGDKREAPKLSRTNARKLSGLLRRLNKDKLVRLKRYESQQQTLAGRSSYSKTDPDATYMKGKDQPFNSLALRPYYNLQIGVQNQFILGYSLHQSPADQAVLADHLSRLDFRPSALIGDAGYGSLANYEWLDDHDITAYVKYPGYDRTPSPYDPRQMDYDLSEDVYRCPQGRKLTYQGDRFREDRFGNSYRLRVYESQDCSGCPVRQHCLGKQQQHRKFEVNTTLNLWRNTIDQRLANSPGKKLKKRRSAEVESVFGQLKRNDGLRRLSMRGLKMGELEVGLKAMAHNLRRMHKVLTEGPDAMAPTLG